MANIENLEFKKLLVEHEFYTLDLEYKTELMKIIQIEFMQHVQQTLDNKQDDYDKIVNLQKISMHNEAEENTVKQQNKKKEKSSKYEKELFHKISKLTHPDKNPLMDETSRQLYSEASNAYTEHDVVKLNQIAKKLNIQIEAEQTVVERLRLQIQQLVRETKIIEQNISWKWHNAESEKDKKSFIKMYIKSAVNHNMT
jgi:hypothetical protein